MSGKKRIYKRRTQRRRCQPSRNKKGGTSARQKGLAAQMRDFTSILPDAYNRRYQLGNIVHSADIKPNAENIYINHTNLHDPNAEAFLQETWNKIKSASSKYKNKEFKEQMSHVMVEDNTDPFYGNEVIPEQMVAPIDESETKKIQDIVEKINIAEPEVESTLARPVVAPEAPPTPVTTHTTSKNKNKKDKNKNKKKIEDEDELDFLNKESEKMNAENRELVELYFTIISRDLVRVNNIIQFNSEITKIDLNKVPEVRELTLKKLGTATLNKKNSGKNNIIFGPMGNEVKVGIVYNYKNKYRLDMYTFNKLTVSLEDVMVGCYLDITDFNKDVPLSVENALEKYRLYYPLFKIDEESMLFVKVDIYNKLIERYVYTGDSIQLGKRKFLKFMYILDFIKSGAKREVLETNAILLDNIKYAY